MLEKLKKYLKETPKEEVLAEWNKTVEECKDIESPKIFDFMQNIKK